MKRLATGGAVSILVALSGCAGVKSTSQSMGSTGTGALVGAASGIGAGFLCSAMGGSTGACVAAGIGAGIGAGMLAAYLDEEWSKSIPATDCQGVRNQLGYDPATSGPLAVGLAVVLDQNPPVYTPGSKFKATLKLAVASASEGQAIPLRLELSDPKSDKRQTTQSQQRACGGYDVPVTVTAYSEEGPQWLQFDVLPETGDKPLASARVCVSVSAKAANHCPKA